MDPPAQRSNSARGDWTRMSPRTSAPIAALLVVFGLLAGPSPAAAVDDPTLDYKTLTTEHFYVHYADRLEGFAHRTAKLAEEAHQIMVPMLEHDPPGRTHIVINDKTDTANGSANVFGRRVIRLYAMPPAPDGVLGFYTDWHRILVYHEYAHILHLDTTGGAVEFLNTLVGGILHPNMLLPRWYTEGLAVMYESQLTGSGRNYSSLFQMWLRTAALEDELFSLGTVSGSPISWPQGSTPYLYGGSFLAYITEKHGYEYSTAFNKLYGRRLAPYSLNQAARQAGGETFHELWYEWDAHEKAESWGEHVAVQARGRTPVEVITDGGGTRRHPHVRPGTNRVTYYHNGLNSHAVFASTRTTTGSSEPLFEVENAVGSSDWTPDGDTLIYGRGAVEKSVYTYQDLFWWDEPSGTHRRLTDGERARDPAVSPDGNRLAYVRVRSGTTDLVVCDLRPLQLYDCETVAGGTLHPSDTKRHWQQLATPAWSPDGEALVFSRWWAQDGQRDLWVVRPESTGNDTPSRITDDAAQDTAPQFGPEGLLYWSSDRTGIFNIYARRLDGDAAWQLSEVETGLFQPAVTPDGEWIYAVTYTTEGYELARFPRPTRLLEPAPQSYAEHPRPDYPEIDDSDWERAEYVAPRWLRPIIVKPDLGATTNGGGVGATILGRGPVGHHDWKLNASLLTSPEFVDLRGNFGLRYDWSGGPFDLNLSVGLRESPRERGYFAESRNIPYVRREYLGSVGLSFPVRRIDDRLSLSSSFEVRRRLFRDKPRTNPEPGDRRPRTPNHGWFNQLSTTLGYADVDRYPQSVSIERGVTGYLSLRVRNELLGSDYESIRMTYSLRGYYPNPLFRGHVAKLSLLGGLGRNEFGDPVFGLGGYRPEDVLSNMIFQDTSGQFVLRGYPPATLVGSQFQVWRAGYRFPVLRIEHGFSTVPIFLRRIKGEVFGDAGGAVDGVLANADLRSSIGAQLQLGTQWGYFSRGALQLGLARGVGEDGITEFFLQYGGGF